MPAAPPGTEVRGQEGRPCLPFRSLQARGGTCKLRVAITKAHVHKVPCMDELVARSAQDTEGRDRDRDGIIEEEAFEVDFERCRGFFEMKRWVRGVPCSRESLCKATVGCKTTTLGHDGHSVCQEPSMVGTSGHEAVQSETGKGSAMGGRVNLDKKTQIRNL